MNWKRTTGRFCWSLRLAASERCTYYYTRAWNHLCSTPPHRLFCQIIKDLRWTLADSATFCRVRTHVVILEPLFQTRQRWLSRLKITYSEILLDEMYEVLTRFCEGFIVSHRLWIECPLLSGLLDPRSILTGLSSIRLLGLGCKESTLFLHRVGDGKQDCGDRVTLAHVKSNAIWM